MMSKNRISPISFGRSSTLALGLVAASLVCILTNFSGCAGSNTSSGSDTINFADNAGTAASEPNHVTVQHILIGFQGSVPGKPITRTRDEAAQLAKQILDRAQNGEDFDALVKKYTDDSAPGIYQMANFGLPGKTVSRSDPSKNIIPRDKMVPAFGDVGFPLKVGEIGMSQHHPQRSPFGWHVVKRIR